MLHRAIYSIVHVSLSKQCIIHNTHRYLKTMIGSEIIDLTTISNLSLNERNGGEKKLRTKLRNALSLRR